MFTTVVLGTTVVDDIAVEVIAVVGGTTVVVVVLGIIVVVVGANVMGSTSRQPRKYSACVVLKRLFSGAPTLKFGLDGVPEPAVA